MSVQQLLSGMRRWLRPPRTLRVTRAGRTYLLLTMGIGLGALNTGNNLLYLVLGVQLAASVLVFHEVFRATEAAGAILVAAGVIVIGRGAARRETA